MSIRDQGKPVNGASIVRLRSWRRALRGVVRATHGLGVMLDMPTCVVEGR
ncbi:hypothetical protein F383_30832 [Gossypium arboreum]|uniref:Uncharacterized protein n=1 Tax=Gossypium arboreum TaxID=29729 RepID=A0A0B0PHD3_GOSAR|nr:hypothetical protein F383_30832 [Gossypium arboreum]